MPQGWSLEGRHISPARGVNEPGRSPVDGTPH